MVFCFTGIRFWTPHLVLYLQTAFQKLNNSNEWYQQTDDPCSRVFCQHNKKVSTLRQQFKLRRWGQNWGFFFWDISECHHFVTYSLFAALDRWTPVHVGRIRSGAFGQNIIKVFPFERRQICAGFPLPTQKFHHRWSSTAMPSNGWMEWTLSKLVLRKHLATPTLPFRCLDMSFYNILFLP